MKLHDKLSHAAFDELYNLLRQAKPWDANMETFKSLENTQNKCEICQHFTALPIRFRVSLPNENELVFGMSFRLTWCSYTVKLFCASSIQPHYLKLLHSWNAMAKHVDKLSKESGLHSSKRSAQCTLAIKTVLEQTKDLFPLLTSTEKLVPRWGAASAAKRTHT